MRRSDINPGVTRLDSPLLAPLLRFLTTSCVFVFSRSVTVNLVLTRSTDGQFKIVSTLESRPWMIRLVSSINPDTPIGAPPYAPTSVIGLPDVTTPDSNVTVACVLLFDEVTRIVPSG